MGKLIPLSGKLQKLSATQGSSRPVKEVRKSLQLQCFNGVGFSPGFPQGVAICVLLLRARNCFEMPAPASALCNWVPGGRMATQQTEPILVESLRLPSRPAEEHVYLDSVSPAMRSIEQVMADIAPTEIPVLLIGESGTGKDAVALHLHRRSARRGQAFRKIPCSSAAPDQFSLDGMERGIGTLYL